MASLLFAFVAVLVVSTGGRDWLLASRLSQRLGNTTALLVAGVIASGATAALMAFAGSLIAARMPGPAQTMLVAIALVVAALELCWQVRKALPEEPTRSFVPIVIVLAARQVGDAARFLVFAFAAGGSAVLAGFGGALGGAAALAIAVLSGREIESAVSLRAIRIALAALLLAVAAWMTLDIRGVIG
ncbi:hypothetical protein [Tsuneonella mangrovi]|uniref:hypothetical protein n=1 Tax=Tsuneonella mangrovi TaxID=1982042 RepID=UPI000BA26A0A|nr:hypothetical protein [Tsuneonella mangrovi]